MTPDFINGCFELGGGLLSILNLLRLYKDKKVLGVSLTVFCYFAFWGLWNLYYYPSLEQWYSLVGGFLITITNIIWVCMAFYYTRKNKHEKLGD